MKLDIDQTQNKSPKEVLESLKPEQWDQLHTELLADENYKSHQTRANLGLILGKLGITDGTIASNDLAKELLSGKYGAPADKTFALSTTQLDWFVELQQS